VTCGFADERKKRKKCEKTITKQLNFTIVTPASLVPKYSLVCPDREVEKAFSLSKAMGLLNSATNYRVGL